MTQFQYCSKGQLVESVNPNTLLIIYPMKNDVLDPGFVQELDYLFNGEVTQFNQNSLVKNKSPTLLWANSFQSKIYLYLTDSDWNKKSLEQIQNIIKSARKNSPLGTTVLVIGDEAEIDSEKKIKELEKLKF